MLAWARTADGWAVNLDGSDAVRAFSLPRLELHSGPRGWTCACHLPDGTSRETSLRSAGSVLAAKRLAVEEALRILGAPWDGPLRRLL